MLGDPNTDCVATVFPPKILVLVPPKMFFDAESADGVDPRPLKNPPPPPPPNMLPPLESDFVSTVLPKMDPLDDIVFVATPKTEPVFVVAVLGCVVAKGLAVADVVGAALDASVTVNIDAGAVLFGTPPNSEVLFSAAMLPPNKEGDFSLKMDGALVVVDELPPNKDLLLAADWVVELNMLFELVVIAEVMLPNNGAVVEFLVAATTVVAAMLPLPNGGTFEAAAAAVVPPPNREVFELPVLAVTAPPPNKGVLPDFDNEVAESLTNNDPPPVED